MLAPLPETGNVVRVRQRTWLVNEVHPGTGRDFARVQLSCLDADAAGDALEVLWQLELSTEIVPERPTLLGKIDALDDPRMFGAYLNALRWDCVTSTDKRLLQAPFRAGIDLKAYQVEPLRKALELPRVNLFIADDVGLGKTIEAGLILQELILRQRVERVLVIAPPAVTMQWQEEMEQRFGLRFEIYNRDFITARRRERGWSINPWTTAPRFIVSSALLRGSKSRKRKGARPTDHLALLLSSLSDRHPRTLLIMDEAHHAAPSSGSAYAIDTRTTRAIRQVTKKFEHRIFLSATPHNGHSNSFSALLELLDPQRFTRGVRVSGVKQLEPIMVRRLKKDLRKEIGGLPRRTLVDHVIPLPPTAPAIRLGVLLAQYEDAYKASLAGLGLTKRAMMARGLVCINLHKRLLSSIQAFHRTLAVHARAVAQRMEAPTQQQLPQAPTRAAGENTSDAELDQREDEFVASASLAPSRQAMALLEEMRAIASASREKPDARLQALAAWIRASLCPDGRWGHRKVVVFTEYSDTLQWMMRQLPGLLGTSDLDGRIARYHGGMGDAQRDELKRAFNLAPEAHPLRILLATDAAREGINLQAHCSDLFHFDLPWNPARVEQRNGRIDRTLQPEEEVFCHYFVLPDRPEDKVLAHMVEKISVITEELGSLSDVLSARLARRMEAGIRGLSTDEIDKTLRPTDRAAEAAKELEGRYAADAARLRGDLGVLERQLDTSQRSVGYDQDHLREAVDLGLTLASARREGLQRIQPATDPPSWRLPDLDRTWEPVLGPIRQRLPDSAPRWKVPPVKPVAFRAAHRLDADTVQLHLGHPLVKRLLARFRAQGFAAHDLARVTVIEDATSRMRRLIAFGRLALYGHGATRLHEEIIAVGAQWSADGDLKPYKRDANKNAAARLLAALAQGPRLHPDAHVQRTLRDSADRDFAALWPHLEAEGAAADAAARAALARRGREEAEEMKALLVRQEQRIKQTLDAHGQLKLRLDMKVDREREQFERDKRSMEERLDEIVKELREEPGLIEASYAVALKRFEPVGLVYLWPGA